MNKTNSNISASLWSFKKRQCENKRGEQAPVRAGRGLLFALDTLFQSHLCWGSVFVRTTICCYRRRSPPSWPSFLSFVCFSILHYLLLFLSLSTYSDAQPDAVWHLAWPKEIPNPTTVRGQPREASHAGSTIWQGQIHNQVVVSTALSSNRLFQKHIQIKTPYTI